MKTTTRWTTAILFILALMAISCGADLSKLPPIVIAPPRPTTPPPAAEAPRATVAFHVVDDLTGQPIPTAIATFEDGTQHQANDDGYIAIEKELNTYQVKISADDYQTATRNVVLIGNRQFAVRLTSTKPAPAPPKPEPPVDAPKPQVPSPKPEPPVNPADAACGVAGNTSTISQACVDVVASVSLYAQPCRVTGAAEPCHYFVREVAKALSTAQNDPRWGLLLKTKGGENVDGYGVDVVAYLPAPLPLDAPTWRWAGVDIVGGLGLPNARLMGGRFNAVISCDDPNREEGKWCNRPADIWAPVPK
jgi:hypothetical protein